MNNYVTEAINLKSYNLNDADKIMVMYSKDNGLIKGVAKGLYIAELVSAAGKSIVKIYIK